MDMRTITAFIVLANFWTPQMFAKETVIIGIGPNLQEDLEKQVIARFNQRIPEYIFQSKRVPGKRVIADMEQGLIQVDPMRSKGIYDEKMFTYSTTPVLSEPIYVLGRKKLKECKLFVAVIGAIYQEKFAEESKSSSVTKVPLWVSAFKMIEAKRADCILMTDLNYSLYSGEAKLKEPLIKGENISTLDSYLVTHKSLGAKTDLMADIIRDEIKIFYMKTQKK